MLLLEELNEWWRVELLQTNPRRHSAGNVIADPSAVPCSARLTPINALKAMAENIFYIC